MGLHCYAQTFSSCGEWGLLFITLCKLITAVTSQMEQGGLSKDTMEGEWH